MSELSTEDLARLPVGSVVMTETFPESYGLMVREVWQKFGGEPEWQFGGERHEWQSTAGGYEAVGSPVTGVWLWNRRATILFRPPV